MNGSLCTRAASQSAMEAPWFVSLRKTMGLNRGWRREWWWNQRIIHRGLSLVSKHAMYNQSMRLPLAGRKRMINPSGGEVSASGHQLLPGLCRFVAWERSSALAPNIVVSWWPNSLLDAGSTGSCAGRKFPCQIINPCAWMMQMQNVQSFRCLCDAMLQNTA